MKAETEEKRDPLYGTKIPTWKQVAHAEIDRAEVLFNAENREASRCVTMAIDGGPCIRCGKPWAQVEVKNIFAEYKYYRPECKCYPKCRMIWSPQNDGRSVDIGCGRILYEEMHGGVFQRNGRRYVRCDNCKREINVDRFFG